MSDLIHGNFLVYQSEDGSTRVDVRLENENIWLNQKQLALLFGKAKGTISEHIKHIFDDGELNQLATVRLFRTVQSKQIARTRAETQFEQFHVLQDARYESDFDRAVKRLTQKKEGDA